MALSSFFFYCSITFFNRVPYIGHDHSSVYRSAVSFRTTWQRRRTKTLPAFTDTLMQPAAIFFISAHHFRFVLPNISHELVQFLPTTWNQLYHSKLFYFMPYERCAWTLCWCDAKKNCSLFYFSNIQIINEMKEMNCTNWQQRSGSQRLEINFTIQSLILTKYIQIQKMCLNYILI